MVEGLAHHVDADDVEARAVVPVSRAFRIDAVGSAHRLRLGQALDNSGEMLGAKPRRAVRKRHGRGREARANDLNPVILEARPSRERDIRTQGMAFKRRGNFLAVDLGKRVVEPVVGRRDSERDLPLINRVPRIPVRERANGL